MPSIEPDVKMRILLAAKKLFAKHGFDATSVRQICEEAGVNLALVSYHFGGKENVLYAMFQAFMPIDRLPELKDDFQDPAQGIRTLIREVVSLRTRDPDLITILQHEIILMRPRIETLRNQTLPLWTLFRDLLALGRERGVFEYESLDNTLLFVLGSIFLYKQREYFEVLLTDPMTETDELVRQTCTFVLNAVKYKGV